MSAQTEYTVYRRDSRDAMTLDAASPVARPARFARRARPGKPRRPSYRWFGIRYSAVASTVTAWGETNERPH